MTIPREVGKQKTKLTNTRELRIFKQTLHLSQLQKNFLFGTLLGDGCLIASRSGKSARLQVRQNWKFKDYVLWKYSLFTNWVRTQPREDFYNNSFYFRTISHPDLMRVKKMFYSGTNRFVPKNVSDLLVDPLSLAVWFMDDGNGYKDRKAVRISSYGFGNEGNLLLADCLKQNFNLVTKIYHDSKGQYLVIPRASVFHFYDLVRPFILPCMMYKFATLTP